MLDINPFGHCQLALTPSSSNFPPSYPISHRIECLLLSGKVPRYQIKEVSIENTLWRPQIKWTSSQSGDYHWEWCNVILSWCKVQTPSWDTGKTTKSCRDLPKQEHRWKEEGWSMELEKRVCHLSIRRPQVPGSTGITWVVNCPTAPEFLA